VEIKISSLCFLFCLVVVQQNQSSNLAGRELGYGLGSLGNSVLGKLSRKHKTNGSLDLSARKSCLLVVGGKLSGFGGDTFKDIVDEGVHDRHTLLGDTGIRVDLLEDLVDVGRVGLDTLLARTTATALLGWCGFLGGLARVFGRSFGHLQTTNINFVRDIASSCYGGVKRENIIVVCLPC